MGDMENNSTKYFFRSESMLKCELLLCTDTAFDCMLELGMLACVQLKPPEFQIEDSEASKPYTVDIRRCAELLKIIDFIEVQVNELNLNMVYYPDIEEDYPPAVDDLSKYENELFAADAELKQIMYNIDELRRSREYHEEKAKALEKAEEFLRDERATQRFFAWSDSTIANILNTESAVASDPMLGLLLGTIATERFDSFERVVFRAFRGNYYMKSSQIILSKQMGLEPKRMERRTVFLMCYMGQSVGTRLMKLCSGYSVHFFDCDVLSSTRKREMKKAQKDAQDIDLILAKTDEYRQRVLNILAADLFIWKFNTRKIMACYVELNKMTLDSKYLTCECWIPVTKEEIVREGLKQASLRGSRNENLVNVLPPILTQVPIEFKEVPPTHFELNPFTRGFQALIDAFGIANYRELNPAPYTIVTFPFLFAVMFGDVGHGVIMFIFALVLIFKNDRYQKSRRMQKSQNEISNLLFDGRYIICLMGLFSIYIGLMYNDTFSKSLLFGKSAWFADPNAWNTPNYQLNPENSKNYRGYPYEFGMDPIWRISGDTAIITYNSVKMKLAIIFGVVHMLFGLVLAAFNQVYFEHLIDLALVTIPQIIIFCALFLYLVVLIFYKWVHYGGHKKPPYNTACAPSILITFINMCLVKPAPKSFEGCNDVLYNGQELTQNLLLGLAFLCMPILLAGKPIYFHIQRWKIRRLEDNELKNSMSESASVIVRNSLYYKIDFAKRQAMRKRNMNIEDCDVLEVWIHSGIHAIDSVLGAISHTASYLRLWALSLAHEQLSHVLWMMVLKRGFGDSYHHAAVLFVAFSVWAVLTISILVTMEALSAFLHTLRLHWVEFQSKFYMGAGVKFMPFQFEKPQKYFD